MKTKLLIQVFLIIALGAFGQKNSLNLKEIKKIASTQTYSNLLSRYLANDTTLSLNDYRILYYGHAFQPGYRSEARHDSASAIDSYINKDVNNVDYSKLSELLQQILKEYPFNLEHIRLQARTYKYMGKTDLSGLWFKKYDNLIKTILSSGDGKTLKKPYIITRVFDEYLVLLGFGLDLQSVNTILDNDKYYDELTVMENKYGISKLCFDTTLHFKNRKQSDY